MQSFVGKLRLGMLFLCATEAGITASSAQETNRDALRQIVEEQCVVHWLQQLGPAPCASMSPSVTQDNHEGYAVLADIKGGAHFLLIPTNALSGIESPDVITPNALNYFAAAWRARAELTARIGHRAARGHVGLAVNSQHARTQDQLHIHIECLGIQIYRVLKASAARLNDMWSPVAIAGQRYQGLRVPGANLDEANPLKLLAEHMPGAKAEMGAYTLLVAGMQFKEGPGFVVLAGKNVPGGPTYLDSACEIEHASSKSGG